MDLFLNVLAGPGALPTSELASAGVARISAGSSVAETAYGLFDEPPADCWPKARRPRWRADSTTPHSTRCSWPNPGAEARSGAQPQSDRLYGGSAVEDVGAVDDDFVRSLCIRAPDSFEVKLGTDVPRWDWICAGR